MRQDGAGSGGRQRTTMVCRGAGGPNGHEGRQRQARRGVETQRAARGGKPSCAGAGARRARCGGRGRPDGEWVYGGGGWEGERARVETDG